MSSGRRCGRVRRKRGQRGRDRARAPWSRARPLPGRDRAGRDLALRRRRRPAAAPGASLVSLGTCVPARRHSRNERRHRRRRTHARSLWNVESELPLVGCAVACSAGRAEGGEQSGGCAARAPRRALRLASASSPKRRGTPCDKIICGMGDRDGSPPGPACAMGFKCGSSGLCRDRSPCSFSCAPFFPTPPRVRQRDG